MAVAAIGFDDRLVGLPVVRIPIHSQRTMESQPGRALDAELQQATVVLETALSEACGTEIAQANTGELLRVEEVLALAGEAAKRAVAIRRRKKRSPAESVARPSGPVATAEPAQGTHRVFLDANGVRWDAFAVLPSADTAGKARLPEPYQRGWLSFDSGEERRRLSPIPEGWTHMTEIELRACCARAEPAPRRNTPGRGSGPYPIVPKEGGSSSSQ